MGPNQWGIFLILTVTTGEGVGPAGGNSPVVCMLKNGLSQGMLYADLIAIGTPRETDHVFSSLLLESWYSAPPGQCSTKYIKGKHGTATDTLELKPNDQCMTER